jgi:hypothetical protein
MAWSGRYKGLVLGYAKVIALSDIVLKVQAGGLAKAQTTGVRHVHAVADGLLVGISNALPEVAQGRLITYSPFDHERSGQFVKGGCFTTVPRRAWLFTISRSHGLAALI